MSNIGVNLAGGGRAVPIMHIEYVYRVHNRFQYVGASAKYGVNDGERASIAVTRF